MRRAQLRISHKALSVTITRAILILLLHSLEEEPLWIPWASGSYWSSEGDWEGGPFMSMRTGISGWSSLASAKFYEYYPQSFGYLGKICIYLFHELLLLLFFFLRKIPISFRRIPWLYASSKIVRAINREGLLKHSVNFTQCILAKIQKEKKFKNPSFLLGLWDSHSFPRGQWKTCVQRQRDSEGVVVEKAVL